MSFSSEVTRTCHGCLTSCAVYIFPVNRLKYRKDEEAWKVYGIGVPRQIFYTRPKADFLPKAQGNLRGHQARFQKKTVLQTRALQNRGKSSDENSGKQHGKLYVVVAHGSQLNSVLKCYCLVFVTTSCQCDQ